MTKEAIREELIKTHQLLAAEKEADLEFHRKKIQSLPLQQRVKEGYAWYPVMVLKSGFTIGNRAYVIVERPEPYKADQFRAGKMVSLFCNLPAKKEDRGGIIQYCDRRKMKIILNTADAPDWLNMGHIGVDLVFDDRTYMEMEKALRKVIEARDNRLADLRDVILGRYQAQYRSVNEMIVSPVLNESQNAAMRSAIGALDVTLVHGPPGTGKTTTTVEIVKQLIQTERTVLVCAPSNAAVDLLTERLAAASISVLRIGNISRVDDEVVSHTLDMKIHNHPDYKQIKKLKIEAAELRRKAKKFKRNFGPEQRKSRGQLFKEAGEVSGWAKQLEDRMLDNLINSAQVITCTLIGANNPVIEKQHYRTVIIDEAAQALEPACWVSIAKADRVIFAGDPFQLPPTIKSNEARRGGLGQTLLEKSLSRQPFNNLLEVQYRMNEAIMGFSNQQFYDGRLIAADSVANHALAADEEASVVFVDTAGADCSEQIQQAYQSKYNEAEFNILREHLYALIDHCDVHQIAPLPSIALISPYREQVNVMRTAVKEDARLADLPIVINTIDGFQGQERDVVYISLVRSNEKCEIGFLKDYRRMNVAMTRARKKLVIVGDSATIGADDFYAAFLDYVEKKGQYRTAWEFMA